MLEGTYVDISDILIFRNQKDKHSKKILGDSFLTNKLLLPYHTIWYNGTYVPLNLLKFNVDICTYVCMYGKYKVGNWLIDENRMKV